MGRIRSRGIGLGATATIIAALFALPLVYLVGRNLGGEPWTAMTDSVTVAALRRTLALASSVAIACAMLGTALAWLVTRTDLPLRRVWRVVLALPLVIPSFVGALAVVAAFSVGGLADEVFGVATRVRGFWVTFAVLTLLSYPYVYLPVLARLGALPATLEESARSLGSPPAAVFARVVLPQTSGAIAGGTLLVFLYVISDFGAVSTLRYDTLAVRIYSSRLFAQSTSLAQGLLLALLALVVIGCERAVGRRRRRTEAVAAGRRSLVTPLRAWKVPSLLGVLAVVTLALVAPLAALGRWAWHGFDGSRVGGPPIETSELVQPALNTAGVALIAAVVAVAVVLPIAYLMRRGSRYAGALQGVVVAGFALPGLVIALALAAWVLQAPVVGGLYQTFPILVYAYVVHFGAQALRSADVAVASVPRRLDDAARSLGAGRLRRFTTIDLPLVLPGLAAGAGLVLLSTMKELPATLLLAPIGFETLATRIWAATEDGFLAEAGATALLLVALSALLTWLLTVRRMDRLER